MNAAVVKKTQDTLGKVIKKPVLTEKLLNRPPFRFLRDIFVEVRLRWWIGPQSQQDFNVFYRTLPPFFGECVNSYSWPVLPQAKC